MLTCPCVLIAQQAAWLTDGMTHQWADYLTICTINAFFLTRLLLALQNRRSFSKVSRSKFHMQTSPQARIFFTYQIVGTTIQRPSRLLLHTAAVFPDKDHRNGPCNLPHLSLLTFTLQTCGCKASSISSSNLRFNTVLLQAASLSSQRFVMSFKVNTAWVSLDQCVKQHIVLCGAHKTRQLRA